MEQWKAAVSKVVGALAFFSGARMAIGAIHTTFLISRGVTIQEFAVLQVIFSATVLVSEVPTGLLSDKIGPKRSLQACCFLLVAYFFLGLLAPAWYPLVISSVVYGVCLCLLSGSDSSLLKMAMDSKIIDEAKFRDSYYHLSQKSSLANCIFGIGGGLLVYACDSFSAPYILGILLAVIAYGISLAIPTGRSASSISFLVTYRKALVHAKTPIGFLYGLYLALFTAAMQPILYLWQPYVIEGFNTNDRIDPALAGIVLPLCFGVYTLSKYCFNKYLRSLLSASNTAAYGVFCSLLAAISLLSMIAFVNYGCGSMAIASFAIFHALVSFPEYALKGEFSRSVSQDICATAISILSMFARVSGLAFMCLIASDDAMNLSELYLIAAILIALTTPIVYVTFKKKEGAYVLNQ